jgi:hypothetical protein
VRTTRREFLALPLVSFPFFWRKPTRVSLAGAEFRIVRRGRSSRRYLHIHGNEHTARTVLERHLETASGIGFLIRNDLRNVPIGGGQLDPNRMFSRVGAEANLHRLNPHWKEAELRRALDELDRGRDRLLKAILPPRGGLLVVLHNNSSGYSVKDELEISDQTSLRQPDDPHAFFLCTNPDDYRILSTSPYNVVLQQHGPKDDDGSLSRLAAKRGIRYANLEVALGKAEQQREMLEWLERNLR